MRFNGLLIEAHWTKLYSKFINHSFEFETNCEAETWTVKGQTCAKIVAKCDICCVEELTFDYDWGFDNNRIPIVCLCGAKKSQGHIEQGEPLNLFTKLSIDCLYPNSISF